MISGFLHMLIVKFISEMLNKYQSMAPKSGLWSIKLFNSIAMIHIANDTHGFMLVMVQFPSMYPIKKMNSNNKIFCHRCILVKEIY